MSLLSLGLLLAATSTTQDTQKVLSMYQLQLPAHPVEGRDYWHAKNGEFVIRSKTESGAIYTWFNHEDQKRIASYTKKGRLTYLWERDSATTAHSMETFRHNDGLVLSYVWKADTEDEPGKWVLTTPNNNHGDVQPYWTPPKPPRR